MVVCLRNKYLNPKPSESLSTEVGRGGNSGCVLLSPVSTLGDFKELVHSPPARDARSVVAHPPR